MVKVLVTGSSGFIGKKLVDRLKSFGCEVKEFDLAYDQNLCNRKAVRQAVSGIDVVFHLAAISDLNWAKVHPIQTMRVNVEGTWNVADACQKAGAWLYFTSTCCVYGNQPYHPVNEDTLPNPAEIYACSKLAGENIIKAYHHTYGLTYNIMRFATIYGEGTRPALATHIFLGQALRGEPLTVHGDGSQTRTLTHINDLIDAIVTLYRSVKINDTWNLTTEEEVSALQMAQDIIKLTGSKSPITFIPQRIGQTQREAVSPAKMLRETGWQAKITWQEGIARMADWFNQTNQKNIVYKMPT